MGARRNSCKRGQSLPPPFPSAPSRLSILLPLPFSPALCSLLQSGSLRGSGAVGLGSLNGVW